MVLMVTVKRADDPNIVQEFPASDWEVMYRNDPNAWVFISQAWRSAEPSAHTAPTAAGTSTTGGTANTGNTSQPKKKNCGPCSRKRL